MFILSKKKKDFSHISHKNGLSICVDAMQVDFGFWF